MRDHDDHAPAAYPHVNQLTASAARCSPPKAGDADAINLWAGQAHALAEDRPAVRTRPSAGATRRAAPLNESARPYAIQIPVPAAADQPARLLGVVAADRHEREPGDRALRADLV